jgi:hypothetical protein
MAQKFTVDPRLVQGAVAQVNAILDDTDSESEEEDELTPQQKKAKERAALLDKLAKEYEQSVKEAKEAAANGEGCTMCSS